MSVSQRNADGSVTITQEKLNPCGDCAAAVGEPHDHGCDVERCQFTGRQWIACQQEDHDDCGTSIWTGIWPGVPECQEFGWYSYFVPNGRPSWVRCGPDDPGASEDLNRLASEQECKWDREQHRWVLRDWVQEKAARAADPVVGHPTNPTDALVITLGDGGTLSVEPRQRGKGFLLGWRDKNGDQNWPELIESIECGTSRFERERKS